MKLLLLAAAVVLTTLAIGCVDDDKSPSMRQRQDAAMKDPWNYSPFEDRTDISGGGVGEFNKDAFRKDVDSAVSP